MSLTREQIEDVRRWMLESPRTVGKSTVNTLCDMALRSLEPPSAGVQEPVAVPLEGIEIIGEYEGENKRRSWWSGGTWLRTGEVIGVFTLPSPPPAVAGMAPSGWKMVPVEPTSEMVMAGVDNTDSGDEFPSTHCIAEVYKAMLTAAPASPASLPDGDAKGGADA